MRTSLNATERLIWSRLQGRKLDGWKFRRQEPIGPYFVDFYCPAAKLVVEIDGPVHWGDAQWDYDERRQGWLEAVGHRVVRIRVAEITRDLGDVMETILAALREQEELGLALRGLRGRRRISPSGGDSFGRPPSPSAGFAGTSP